MLKKIGLGLFAVIVILQFFRIDKENPEVIPRKDFITQTNPSDNIKAMLKNACYDCHSNTTKYPWYSNVAPISWWLKDHIDEGRKHLNFSEWVDYPLKKQQHKLEECWEMVENKEMPLKSYLYTHSEADLTDQERETLEEWFKLLEQSLASNQSRDVSSENKKWQINKEVTDIIDKVRLLLKEHKNETDLSKINAMGVVIDDEINKIAEVFDAEEKVLDQFNAMHSEAFYNLQHIKSIDNVKDAHSIILVVEQNLNNYHNYFETKKTLELNDGQKWEANIETTNGVNKMLEIVAQNIEDGRLSHYAAMGEQLNIELNTIFSSCTMKGKAHEQLHLFIMPLKNMCEQLEFVANEAEAMVLQKNILKQLNLYSTYFKTATPV